MKASSASIDLLTLPDPCEHFAFGTTTVQDERPTTTVKWITFMHSHFSLMYLHRDDDDDSSEEKHLCWYLEASFDDNEDHNC